jgi:hypothetical protein
MAVPLEEIDRLYGLPLEQFTPARDALASSLRADKRRADADEVKRLRKPNLVAWALNQVRRRDPDRVSELLAAGERLRNAQREVVSGGDRGLLRDAVADERRRAEEVVARAEQALIRAGHAPSPALQGRVRSTLRAAATGGEAGELLRAGRLVHDYEVSDLGLGTVGAGDPVAAGARAKRPPPRRPRAQAERKEVAERARAQAEAERTRRAITGALARARARAASLSGKLDEAERRAAQARRVAARAAGARARAPRAVEEARDRAAAAGQRVAELEASLTALADGR